MNFYVYPYSSGSESAKLLAAALDGKRIRLQNSTYQYKEGDLIINWGNSSCPHPCLNSAEALQDSINKLRCFRKLRGRGFDAIPDYWTSPDDIPVSAFPVFCRTQTAGCDGAGIVVAHCKEELVDAKLYTRRIPGEEYRVTVFQGEVTDVQTKLPRNGVPTLSYEVRTYANGWGFQRRTVEPETLEIIRSLACDALTTLGLDFAGFDIVYNPSEKKAYLLEANTAMGLEGGALTRFVAAIQRYAARLEVMRAAEAVEKVPQSAPAVSGEAGVPDYEEWLRTAPVTAAGGVDYRTILRLIADRLA